MARSDVEAVADLEARVPSPWNASLIVSELKYAGSVALIGETAGEVAGWCCCRHENTEAELLKLTVTEKWRRRSVAARLLNSLESRLRTMSVESLYLEVRSENVPALAFYGQAGFTVQGKRINYYSQPRDDAVLLRKLLYHH